MKIIYIFVHCVAWIFICPFLSFLHWKSSFCMFSIDNLNKWTCPSLFSLRFNITWPWSFFLMGRCVVYLSSFIFPLPFEQKLSVHIIKPYLSCIWQQYCLALSTTISYFLFLMIEVNLSMVDRFFVGQSGNARCLAILNNRSM